MGNRMGHFDPSLYRTHPIKGLSCWVVEKLLKLSLSCAIFWTKLAGFQKLLGCFSDNHLSLTTKERFCATAHQFRKPPNRYCISHTRGAACWTNLFMHGPNSTFPEITLAGEGTEGLKLAVFIEGNNSYGHVPLPCERCEFYPHNESCQFLQIFSNPQII